MPIRRHFCVLALSSMAVTSFAAPVEYDTDDFHLVVCRPFDSWSGDASTMDDQLDAIGGHRAQIRYMVSDATKEERGAGRTLLNGPSDDPLTTDTIALVKSRGFSISHHGSYFWRMGTGAELEPSDYPRLREAQSAMYDALIRQQGDPDKIPGSMRSRRVLGNLLALGSIGLGMNRFGGTGAYVVTTALAGDIAQIPIKVRQAFAPFDLPSLDKFQIAKIEVYPVGAAVGATPGQVVVAYRTPPTDEMRHAALVQAMASLTGSDTTPQAIQASRAADLQRRNDYWNACVSAHRCGATNDQGGGDNK